MNKEDIIDLPNKHLRQRSKKIGFIDNNTKKLVKDMQDATLSWEDSRKHEVGVALAAVQIDCLQRVVIIRNDFDDKNDRSFQVLINPEITKLDGKLVDDFEGCLSIKNIYGKVARYSRVKIKAKNLAGREVRITAEGFLARVLQHEIDHTNGKVFIDHIKENEDAFYKLTDDGSLQKLDYEKDVALDQDLWG